MAANFVHCLKRNLGSSEPASVFDAVPKVRGEYDSIRSGVTRQRRENRQFGTAGMDLEFLNQ